MLVELGLEQFKIPSGEIIKNWSLRNVGQGKKLMMLKVNFFAKLTIIIFL